MEMDAELTNQAIAELMREIEGQDTSFPTHKQSERKVNPLGKTNKRFLGRTINTAIRHNKRENERTQANCRQKLQDLDEVHEKRKSNYFYNRDAHRNRSVERSRSTSSSRSRSRSRHKKDKKRRSRRRNSSESSSRSRSRSKRRKKHKKKAKKHKKSQRRRRKSRSRSLDREILLSEAIPIAPPSEMFLNHSKQMAMAVAMAYSQVLMASRQKEAKELKERSSSPLSDIVRELMSDEEQEKSKALYISSSDEGKNVLTIDVSSNSESKSSAGSSDSDSDSKDSAGSCIYLDASESDNNSDMEIIECHEEQEKASKPAPGTEIDKEKQQVDQSADLTTVDLTED
ncbi:arginine/serine-rich coiled-coil protein 2 [Drosophila rhopaloa]|uniref:Arginine/serine-rich coiled-coil protein 2 n=1 Tax=Drosophila rhopaloa TaxID=1041015 RepID=A0A6P4F743_DRORH|nr:arginine/serine-rich coiled-coil protein 2 [Drosophila rhopaloa]